MDKDSKINEIIAKLVEAQRIDEMVEMVENSGGDATRHQESYDALVIEAIELAVEVTKETE